MKLRSIPHGDAYGIGYQCVFGGLDRRLSAADGAVAAMENMSADHYPLLAPRSGRYKLRTLAAPNGMGAGDKLFWVDGTKFYYDGKVKGKVSNSPKRFTTMNHWVVIWPDKLCYNTATDIFSSLETRVTSSWGLFCSDPAPGGISSEANCLQLDGVTVEGPFQAGEAVTISGCTLHPENNQTLVIREVGDNALYFYDNTFAMDETRLYTVTGEGLAAGKYGCEIDGASYVLVVNPAMSEGDTILWRNSGTFTATIDGISQTMDWYYGDDAAGHIEFGDSQTTSFLENGAVTVSRTVPDLDHVCQSGNRLWGVKDSSVYCSALGDPRVWNNYDGTATGCWSVEAGSAGPFTGAVAYGGYPLLFKEDRIYRVYGTKPANFQLMDTQTLGCETGSEKSFAVVGQTLYYRSPAGFVAYAGGVPVLMDDALGIDRRYNAVAGTDGRKYYVSVTEPEGRSLYVYDTVLGLWHREDASEVMDFVWCDGELYMLCADGTIWQCGRIRTPAGAAEGTVSSTVEFADFYGNTVARKAIRRLYFRVETDKSLTLSVSYDGGPWQTVSTVTRAQKGIQTLQLIPRRCDSLRVKLEGVGPWKVWAMGKEYYAGSTR